MNKIFLYFVLFLLTACQPTSLEDFQSEGGFLARHLLKDLRQIESREDLNAIEPILRRDFEKIVDLIIQARSFQQKNPDVEVSFQNINEMLNLSLIDELKRVYAIEGGRECVERAQKEAMLKLDAKERLFQKQQSSVRLK